MITAKYSTTMNAMSKRIKNLPKFLNTSVDTVLKRDAQGIVESFKEGISSNRLGLLPLKDVTIKSKRSNGFSKPKTPLYGKGDNNKRSYMNMLIIRKLKNGYRIRVRAAMHYTGLPFKMLYNIHEFGATISTKKGVIVIPPRPAKTIAYQQWLRKRKKIDNGTLVKKSINEWIRTARSVTMNHIKSKQEATLKGEDYVE